MSAATEEIVVRGEAAAPGLAAGPLYVHRVTEAPPVPRGEPAQERSALDAAIAGARAELEALAAASDAMGQEILAFQMELLDDPELIEPAVEAIGQGEAAAQAWERALELQIAIYRDSGDDFFAARAADLEDLRDRVSAQLAGGGSEAPRAAPGTIYLAETLTPSRFLALDWDCFAGAALLEGSAAGHVAILARARGVPLVIGLGADLWADLETLGERANAVLDAEVGQLVLHPSQATSRDFRARREALNARADEERRFLASPARTAAGAPVTVLINLDDPDLLDAVDPAHCDGIGLTRTELLFSGAALPDEETQLRLYRRVIDWAAGKPVTIRTLDAGGDKPVAGLTLDDETNPFLGLRGLRLSLARPEIFRVQLRALLRAAALGPLKVMLPMVTVPAELEAARDLLLEEFSALTGDGVEAALPALGMMVEVPAAAFNVAQFEVDFFSIGSNDLIQYLTAASRDNSAVAGLYDPGNPAVLELIARVCVHGRATGKEVSLCGDMASDPDQIEPLLAAGMTTLSVAPAALARIKAAIARA